MGYFAARQHEQGQLQQLEQEQEQEGEGELISEDRQEWIRWTQKKQKQRVQWRR